MQHFYRRWYLHLVNSSIRWSVCGKNLFEFLVPLLWKELALASLKNWIKVHRWCSKSRIRAHIFVATFLLFETFCIVWNEKGVNFFCRVLIFVNYMQRILSSMMLYTLRKSNYLVLSRQFTCWEHVQVHFWPYLRSCNL